MKRDICLIVVVSLLTSIPSALADDGSFSINTAQAVGGIKASAYLQYQSKDSITGSIPTTDLSPSAPAADAVAAPDQSSVISSPLVTQSDMAGLPAALVPNDVSPQINAPEEQVGPEGQANSCYAQDNKKDAARRAKELSKATARYRAVLKVLGDVTQSTNEGIVNAPAAKGLDKLLDQDKKIPAVLGKNAKCIAIIPSEKAIGAFGLYGAEYGAGMYTCARIPGTENFDMSQGHFIQFKGGSFGPQTGIKMTDQVLLFTGDDAERSLASGSFQVGGDAAAMFAVGRDASASLTNGNIKNRVYSYSHSEGLYAGIAIKGGRLTLDKAMEASVQCTALPKPQNFFQKLVGWLHHKAPQNDANYAQVNDIHVDAGGTIGQAPTSSTQPDAASVSGSANQED